LEEHSVLLFREQDYEQSGGDRGHRAWVLKSPILNVFPPLGALTPAISVKDVVEHHSFEISLPV
jgi:hypothetical protein